MRKMMTAIMMMPKHGVSASIETATDMRRVRGTTVLGTTETATRIDVT